MRYRFIVGILAVVAVPGWFRSAAWPVTRILSAAATRYEDGRVLLQWRSSDGVDSLGFNIYREAEGVRRLATPQLIAGSALWAGGGAVFSAGRLYSWWDRLPEDQQPAEYWIEELDLNGRSTWHGPVSAEGAFARALELHPELARSPLLAEASMTGTSQESTQPLQPRAPLVALGGRQNAPQFNLAGQPAVKIAVREEGLYRVAREDLAAAGLDLNVNFALLQLFVDGREQPIKVLQQEGQLSAVEFYGVGMDSPYTDLRVYWLVAGSQPGQRIPTLESSAAPGTAASFLYTVERRDRSVYFSALLNGEKENFFGALITANPVDQVVRVEHMAADVPGEAQVTVTLQGVTALAHSVEVLLNGATLGTSSFFGQTLNTTVWKAPQGRLQEGNNTVTLRARGTSPDVSLVDSIRITYWRRYDAGDGLLRLAASGGEPLTIEGFTNGAIRVLDVTDAEKSGPLEVAGIIRQLNRVPERSRTRYLSNAATGAAGPFRVTFTVPGAGQRRVLALTSEQIKRPVWVTANLPSSWSIADHAADYLIITRREFFPSVEPLRALRQSQGLSVAVVDVEDLYDEFSYGQKTPQALRDFLSFAAASWSKPPRFLLLVGHASLDPKNYLGFGDSDLVPTKLIDTVAMETASDDWFVESEKDGLPKLAMGRLPARDKSEADLMISKIVAHEQSVPTPSVLFVAGQNDDGYDFEAANAQLRALMPGSFTVSEIRRGADPATAKGRLLEAIHSGVKLVNYVGHGSVDLWGGELLTDADARALENDRLPVFVAMTCLNGYFHDPALDSLAESLLKAPRGGAAVVWASSGLTTPPGQLVLSQQFYRLLFANDPGGSSATTLGEAAVVAKSAVTDPDVRRTWILFGDPAAHFK